MNKPDKLDIAADLQQAANDTAIANHMANREKRDTWPNECEECGLLISSERQIATGGTPYCVDCAEVLDFKRRNKC